MEIGYFPTSVQKLYKINDGEWQTYTGKIRLEIDDIVYAKGIDVDNNETRIVSEDKAVLPDDALAGNAYDNVTSSYDSVSSVKRIYVSKEMRGKQISIRLMNGGFANQTVASCDSNGTSTTIFTVATNGTVAVKEATIPEDSEYLTFTFGGNFFYIYEIRIIE